MVLQIMQRFLFLVQEYPAINVTFLIYSNYKSYRTEISELYKLLTNTICFEQKCCLLAYRCANSKGCFCITIKRKAIKNVVYTNSWSIHSPLFNFKMFLFLHLNSRLPTIAGTIDRCWDCH